MQGLQGPSLQGSRGSGGAPWSLPLGTARFSVILGLSRDQTPCSSSPPDPNPPPCSISSGHVLLADGQRDPWAANLDFPCVPDFHTVQAHN